jgi:hypothetical protein
MKTTLGMKGRTWMIAILALMAAAIISVVYLRESGMSARTSLLRHLTYLPPSNFVTGWFPLILGN